MRFFSHPQQKLRIPDQVPAPLVRLLQHQLHPLEAVAAYPARRALEDASPVIEEAADADCEFDIDQALAIVVDPALLERVAHPHQEQVRARGVDLREDRVVLARVVVAVLMAGDDQSGKRFGEMGGGARDDLRQGAEEEVAIAALHRVHEEERQEVGADQVGDDLLALPAGGPADAGAIAEDRVAAVQDPAVRGVVVGEVQRVRVHYIEGAGVRCRRPHESLHVRDGLDGVQVCDPHPQDLDFARGGRPRCEGDFAGVGGEHRQGHDSSRGARQAAIPSSIAWR